MLTALNLGDLGEIKLDELLDSSDTIAFLIVKNDILIDGLIGSLNDLVTAYVSEVTNIGASNYKYQWWLLGEGGDYSTFGKDGQYVYVNPEKNLILVRLGETDGGIYWFKVFQELAKGIR